MTYTGQDSVAAANPLILAPICTISPVCMHFFEFILTSGGGIVTARASNVTGSGGRPTTPIWRVKLPARLPFIPPKNLQSIELCTCRLWNGHDRTCSRTLPPTAGLAKGSAIVTVPQPARVGSSRSFGSGHTRAARGRNMDDQHSRRYLRWPRFVEIAGVERTL
jgi:hypothetical protein